MAENKEANPSMEDILNTIRGVIAGEDEQTTLDDESQKKAKAAAAKPEVAAPKAAAVEAPKPPAPKAEEDDGDILELTELVEAEESQVTEQAKKEGSDNFLDDIDNMLEANADLMGQVEEEEPTVDNQEDAMIEVAPQQVAPVAPAPAPKPQVAESASQAKERLLSDTAAATSQAVLKEMMASVPRAKVDSPATRGGTTLEDLVIEAIRPYLAQWLDKNLATIVKQLVEKEIKHLIPRDSE